MKYFLSPPDHGPSLNRHPNVVESASGIYDYMTPPADRFSHTHPTPSFIKKFSPSSHIYKHVYATSPSKPIHTMKKKKYKEESWFDDMNPFGEYSSDSETVDEDL